MSNGTPFTVEKIVASSGPRAQGEGVGSGGAMVLGKLPVPGRPTIWITVGPTSLAVGAGGSCLAILICPFSPLSLALWETTRYRLMYCLKGPLTPKQPTNQNRAQGYQVNMPALNLLSNRGSSRPGEDEIN